MEKFDSLEPSLEDLYNEVLADRKNLPQHATQEQLTQLEERDTRRKKLVMQYLENNRVTTDKDFHHAALILQHGDTTEDYQKAHQLAAKALALGDNTAKWLYAATYDRWQLSMNKPQKYGTQFKLMQTEIMD